MKNYAEARRYLYSLHKRGIKMGLANMKVLCRIFDNPQNKFKSIHIAGTNGKGSVAAYCGSVLRLAGYRCGLYTSPHLLDYTERILVNESPVTKAEILELANLVEERVQQYNQSQHDEDKRIQPTFFEVMTMIAFLHFERAGIEVAVLETGLGGRLDASNVVKPEVTAITSIGLEHENWLGIGLKNVAREKAGILKRGAPGIVGKLPPEAQNAVLKEAEKKNVELLWLGRDFDLSGKPSKLQFTSGPRKINGLSMNLLGEHQRDNAAVALAMLETLKERGFEIPDKAMREGMARMRWPGRLELFGNGTPWLVDGAHNPAGIRALVDTVKKNWPSAKILCIFSTMSDKNAAEVTSVLEELDPDWLLTQPKVSRARKIEYILEQLKDVSPKPRRRKRVSEALRLAHELEGDYDMILVCGSLYLVGEAYSWLERKLPRKNIQLEKNAGYPPLFLTGKDRCKKINLKGE